MPTIPLTAPEMATCRVRVVPEARLLVALTKSSCPAERVLQSMVRFGTGWCHLAFSARAPIGGRPAVWALRSTILVLSERLGWPRRGGDQRGPAGHGAPKDVAPPVVPRVLNEPKREGVWCPSNGRPFSPQPRCRHPASSTGPRAVSAALGFPPALTEPYPKNSEKEPTGGRADTMIVQPSSARRWRREFLPRRSTRAIATGGANRPRGGLARPRAHWRPRPPAPGGGWMRPQATRHAPSGRAA